MNENWEHEYTRGDRLNYSRKDILENNRVDLDCDFANPREALNIMQFFSIAFQLFQEYLSECNIRLTCRGRIPRVERRLLGKCNYLQAYFRKYSDYDSRCTSLRRKYVKIISIISRIFVGIIFEIVGEG